MRTKPKNASEKRNHIKIWYDIRAPIFKKLSDLHRAGGILSLFNVVQLDDLADAVTKCVMKNEDIEICLKRRRTC